MTVRVTLPVGLLLILMAAAGGYAQSTEVRWDEALDRPGAWYASSEAVRIADNVLLYQRISGGWPKNIDMARPLSEEKQARLRRAKNNERATIDNGATYTQMRFLARVYNATEQMRFKRAFLRGLDYLLEAQYEDSGGWPQFYPNPKGYHRFVTFNDDAMMGVMRLLRGVAKQETMFAFVDDNRRQKVSNALQKGLDFILKTQIVVEGRRTGWCAQYHPETLQPVGARSYEHPSISGSESVGIVRYLMEIESPEAEVVAAVQEAVNWFERAGISGLRVDRINAPLKPEGWDKVVIADTTAPVLWARFYEIGTNRPIFSGRDGVVRYKLGAIEHERRTGYSWLGDWPQKLLQVEYPAWQKKWTSR